MSNTGTVYKKGDNWQPDYNKTERWEIFLSDLTFGMVNRANGETSQIGAMSGAKRNRAKEMYGDRFVEILELAQECRNL